MELNTLKPTESSSPGKNTLSKVTQAAESVRKEETKVINEKIGEESNAIDSVSRSRIESRASNEMLDKATREANKALMPLGMGFQYKVHEKTNRVMVKVIDIINGDVIREIPPEKEMDAVAKMWEMAGILVDKKS